MRWLWGRLIISPLYSPWSRTCLATSETALCKADSLSRRFLERVSYFYLRWNQEAENIWDYINNWYRHKTPATLCKLCLSRQGYYQALIKSVSYCLSPVSFSASAVSGFVHPQMQQALLSPLREFSPQGHLPSSLGHLLWAKLFMPRSSLPPKSLPSFHISLGEPGLCCWEVLVGFHPLTHKQGTNSCQGFMAAPHQFCFLLLELLQQVRSSP